MSTELITLEKNSLEKMFMTEAGLLPLLTEIEAKVQAIVIEGEITKEETRKAIKAKAKMVVSSKTFLEAIGSELTEEWRANTARVNSQKNLAKEKLDKLRDSILSPVKEYEDEFKKRAIALAERIEKMNNVRSLMTIKTPKETLEANLAGLKRVSLEDEDWGELEPKAYQAKDLSIKHIEDILADKDKYDEEQKELEELRAFKEQKKKQEEEEAQRKIKDEQEKEELKRKLLEAEEREQKAKLDAENAEKKKQEDLVKEEERKKKEIAEAEARAIREAEEKKLADQERIIKENEAIENRRVVHNNILSSFLEFGISEDEGKNIISAIAKNKIPHLSISYTI